jgi:hypothetical protein
MKISLPRLLKFICCLFCVFPLIAVVVFLVAERFIPSGNGWVNIACAISGPWLFVFLIRDKFCSYQSFDQLRTRLLQMPVAFFIWTFCWHCRVGYSLSLYQIYTFKVEDIFISSFAIGLVGGAAFSVLAASIVGFLHLLKCLELNKPTEVCQVRSN